MFLLISLKSRFHKIRCIFVFSCILKSKISEHNFFPRNMNVSFRVKNCDMASVSIACGYVEKYLRTLDMFEEIYKCQRSAINGT